MATASSRIFIRNLPPSLTDDDFRKHFSRSNDDVTDTKFLRHRRIGYVGYKTEEEATNAVKYFNKSFIRMSRISVELAKSVADLSAVESKRNDVKSKEEVEMENPLKRKRENPKPTEPNPKLSEFLGIMGQKKSKTWQNERTDEVEPVMKMLEEDDSDEELQVIGQTDEPEPELDEMKMVAAMTKNNNTNVSDMDWLKSKAKVLSDDLEVLKEDNVRKVEVEQEPTKDEKAKISPVATESVQLDPSEKISRFKRLYLRNLLFTATEDDIREKFGEFGEIEEVHMPMNSSTNKSKGFAFVLYYNGDDALKAWKEMDGKTFQGRLIHILAAEPKVDQGLDEFAISQLPLKQQNAIKRKLESTAASIKWNPLYMNMDDVMTSMAARLGVNKSEILDPTSSDAAVKQAVAETHLIQEAKSYFSRNGIDLDSFKPGKPRGDTAILVKNFPHGTSAQLIRNMFSPFGEIVRLLIPPSGTMALVEFSNSSQGKSAFNALKYKRVEDSILFLEKAPKTVFSNTSDIAEVVNTTYTKVTVPDLLQDTTTEGETNTLFVRNLNFSTKTQDLSNAFKNISGFLTARVKTKANQKDPNQPLSLGFGFVEFKSNQDAQVALKIMNGQMLDGFKLDIRPSQKALDAAEEKRKEQRAKNATSMQTKVVIKNLPFEANKRELRTLLTSYGRVRSVRLPKKFDSSSRGFAFVEFTTPNEAANAMDALKNTHLLGRRLHIEYASVEDLDAEAEIERMQKKVGSQVSKVAIQVHSSRKKFNMAGGEEDAE